MVKRNLDPCFFNIIRNEQVDRVCLSDMTLEERNCIFSQLSETDLRAINNKLCDALSFIGDYYNIEFIEALTTNIKKE